MQKELIIFDMDGTLIDSGNVITNTINYVRTNIGLSSIPKEDMLHQLNNPDINAAEYFYGTKEFTSEQTKLFGEYYDKNCISDIVLYDGIKEMLEITEVNFRLSIATNASVEFAKKMVRHLNINSHFEFIIGANCVDNPKPHPDMLLKTLETLNVKSEKSILVGDSHKDLRAAQSANIDNILVNWGFSDHGDDEAVHCVEQLSSQLLDLG
ncbi:MAG: HAD family hydrolase [Campylobacterota bacterium]|nr:HAD family hydrolase [Campylobacterota bacterium]